jgi:uridine phosphorylase
LYVYILIKHGLKILMTTVELLNGNPAEGSVFKAGDFIRTRKKPTADLRFPKYCVLGFSPHFIRHCKRRYRASVLDYINRGHPYLLFQYRGISMAFVYPGIGAPLASAILDETFALGAESCVFIGSAGALVEGFQAGDLILPTRAVRDEGTSFHYAPPGRHAFPDPHLVDTIRKTLREKAVPFREGSTWTTDGVYREIPSKINRLRDEGCLSVDMEASALFSVAEFYGKKIAGLFSASDSISGAAWKPLPRGTNPKSVSPAGLLDLALDSLANLHSGRKQ